MTRTKERGQSPRTGGPEQAELSVAAMQTDLTPEQGRGHGLDEDPSGMSGTQGFAGAAIERLFHTSRQDFIHDS